MGGVTLTVQSSRGREASPTALPRRVRRRFVFGTVCNELSNVFVVSVLHELNYLTRPVSLTLQNMHFRYLLSLGSCLSVRNIGGRFVSSWLNRWQQWSCRSCLCPSYPDLLSACLAMFSLVFRFSSYYLLVSILGPG